MPDKTRWSKDSEGLIGCSFPAEPRASAPIPLAQQGLDKSLLSAAIGGGGDERLPTNASSGPITDLEVDVYGVDGDGNRLDDACHPAKGKISVQELFREILSGGMSGTLDAIGSRAQSVYPPGMLAGMPANLGAYGGMFTDHILTAPGLSSILRNAQQQMVDNYPQVIPRDQSSEVLYSAPRVVEVRVDLRFADDVGNL